ncbi:MAG: RNA polymerase sigma factor [Niabella sp.]
MNAKDYSNITDNNLLQRYKQSHENLWLGILLQRYTLLLLGVCMKYLKDENEAQDAVQQVFLKVIQEVDKYQIDYFKSWLYMVAKNYCLTTLRNNKTKYTYTLSDNHIQVLPDIQENHTAENGQVTPEALAAAIEQLNKEQKQCVTLFYLQKQSYAEISNTTGYNMKQVKSFIQNGKRNLKIILEKNINQSPSQNG